MYVWTPILEFGFWLWKIEWIIERKRLVWSNLYCNVFNWGWYIDRALPYWNPWENKNKIQQASLLGRPKHVLFVTLIPGHTNTFHISEIFPPCVPNLTWSFVWIERTTLFPCFGIPCLSRFFTITLKDNKWNKLKMVTSYETLVVPALVLTTWNHNWTAILEIVALTLASIYFLKNLQSIILYYYAFNYLFMNSIKKKSAV